METNPQHQPAAGRPVAPRRVPGLRQAFTLTELLVVITIIAVLAALVTVAAVKAMAAAKRARIQLEIGQIAQSFEDFKSDYGAYPPNGASDGSNTMVNNLSSDFTRMFKKAFPRSKEDPNLVKAIAGVNVGGTITNLVGGLSPSEAVYFWLGGFSDDPEYPLSGKGGPSFDTSTGSTGEIVEARNRRFEFDLTRIGPRDGNGTFTGRSITYKDPRNNNITRQINFWQYVPSGSQRPYVFFDVSRHKCGEYVPVEVDRNTGNAIAYPVLSHRQGVKSSSVASDIVFANQKKFQVLHAGLDDEWGVSYGGNTTAYFVSDSDVNSGNWLLFPEGPFTGEIADNLTNFTSGELQSAQEE